MNKRKTIPVTELVDMVNLICKTSDPMYKEVRQGAINLLEGVLFKTGNFQGFTYLLEGDCEGLPGVNYGVNEDGIPIPHPDYVKRFANTDSTRVRYFK